MKTISGSVIRRGLALLAITLVSSTVRGDETQEKTKPLPAAILRKYDLDKNGQLNDEEKAAWKADLQRGREAAQARRLEQYDVNKDGKLDKAEKAAAKAGGIPKKRTSKAATSGGEGDDESPPGETGKAVAAKGAASSRK